MRLAVASRNTHILGRLPEVTSPKASRKPAEGGKTSGSTRRVAAPPDSAIISDAGRGRFQRNEEPGRELIPRTALGRVSRTRRLRTTVRNCTRDEGGPFEVGSQVQVSSHRELLSSRAMVVSVAETPGHDPGRQG